MEAYTFCQSCGMPMNKPEHMGTEKDGSKSSIYCSCCYQKGAFTDPGITLAQMKDHVREELVKIHIPEAAIEEAVGELRHLSRWLGIPAVHHSCDWH